MSDLDEARLGAWLDAHVAGFAGPFTVEKFPGGQSNPTYRIAAASGGYVLRRKPFGPILPSAHAVDREHRLLSALHPNGFPVARPYGLCEDDSVLGAPFYVMDLVDGVVHWDGRLDAVPRADRAAIHLATADTLAALHRIDPVAVGLDGFGRPDGFFARQVARWTKQYRAAETDTVEAMDKLIDWLPRTLPAQSGTTIVHGDYRLDNVIMAPDRPRIRAVLDWELATLGDPLADLSYLLLNWLLPGSEGGSWFGGVDLAEQGLPTMDEMVARYRAGSDIAVPDSLEWYFAFGLFRLASIHQGIKRRMLDGIASSTEAARYAARVTPIAELAWQRALLAGA